MSRQSELIDISQGVAGNTVVNGSAKAWISFNHQTITILDNENISSLSDLGTGRLLINFSNNMANTNYAIMSGASKFDHSNVDNNIPNIGLQRSSTSIQTNLIDFTIGWYTNPFSVYDVIYGAGGVMGDLA